MIGETDGFRCLRRRWPRASSQIEKETLACAIVGSATVPTSFGGHGGPPYGLKHLKFHISAAAGRERPVKSREKLMNVEHRTSNIERRIMWSARFKKDFAKRFHHSTFDIRHSSFYVVSYKLFSWLDPENTI